MRLKEAKAAVIAPVGVRVDDDILFDTSWGRFLDLLASNFKHIYTFGKPLSEKNVNICTYKLKSSNVTIDMLPEAKSSLHALPQAYKRAKILTPR